MKIHPAAEIFPAMTENEFAELKADIASHGLHTPVEVFEGAIIDGRHRFSACRELGVEPDAITLDKRTVGDPFEYVVSVNLHRRHLSSSQRSMIAVRIKRALEAASAEPTKTEKNGAQPGGKFATAPKKSRDKAGAAVGVSGRAVQQAETVIEQGSKAVIEAVNDGTLAVSAAEKIVRKSANKNEQTKALKQKISGGATFDTAEIEAAELSTEDRMKEWNRQVEAYARSITSLASEAPQGGWWDESQANITAQQLKSAAGSVRQAKCDNVCPLCEGTGCKRCKDTGFMPKRTYEMAGGK